METETFLRAHSCSRWSAVEVMVLLYALPGCFAMLGWLRNSESKECSCLQSVVHKGNRRYRLCVGEMFHRYPRYSKRLIMLGRRHLHLDLYIRSHLSVLVMRGAFVAT